MSNCVRDSGEERLTHHGIGRYNVQYALGETQSQFAMRQHILASNRSNRDEVLYSGTPDSVGYQLSAVDSSQRRNEGEAQD